MLLLRPSTVCSSVNDCQDSLLGYSSIHGDCVQSLVAVDERGAREERALIAAYLRDLVPVLLLHQSQEQLQEVASLIGITLLATRHLLAQCWHPSMSSEQAIEFVHASVLQTTAASTARLDQSLQDRVFEQVRMLWRMQCRSHVT